MTDSKLEKARALGREVKEMEDKHEAMREQLNANPEDRALRRRIDKLGDEIHAMRVEGRQAEVDAGIRNVTGSVGVKVEEG